MNFYSKDQSHTAIHVPFFFKSETKRCQGLTRNISFNGVLLKNCAGNSMFYHGDVGECQFYIGEMTFNIQGQVLRRVGSDLAIRFIDIGDKQAQFLLDIIQENSVYKPMMPKSLGM